MSLRRIYNILLRCIIAGYIAEGLLFIWAYTKYKQLLFLVGACFLVLMFSKLLQRNRIFIFINALISTLIACTIQEYADYYNFIFIFAFLICHVFIAATSFLFVLL